MAATAEGVFRIIDRASGPMRRIQAQAMMTDQAIDRLGKRLDQIGTRNQVSKLKGTENELRAMRSESDKVTDSFRRTETATTRMGSASRRSSRDSDTLTRSMRAGSRQAETFGSRLIHVGASLLSIQKIIGVMKLPALATGIGFAVQAVAALAGGLVTLLPRIAQLGGAVAALPATFIAMGLAMGTVKLAFSDLGKAMGGNQRAMKGLTPEARRFVQTLKEYKPVMQSIRQEAQRGLFPGLDMALRRAQAAVPMARQLVRRAGTQLGSGVSRIVGEQTGFGALQDWGSLGNQGVHIIGLLMRSVGNLLNALRNFAVAAEPFTRWLTDTVEGWTKWAEAASRAGRDSGRIAAFLNRTRQSMTLFGHILRNLGETFLGIGRAAGATGDSLWRSAERATAAWARFANSIGGQVQMVEFFRSTRTVLTATMGLVVDLARAITSMGTAPGIADNIQHLRAAVPAIRDVLNTFVTVFMPALVDLLVQVVRILGLITAATGPINIILRLVAGILRLFNDLINSSNVLRHAFASLFTVVAVGLFVRRLVVATRTMFGFAAATNTAAAAQVRLAEAEGIAAAGGRVGALSRLGGFFGFGGRGRVAGRAMAGERAFGFSRALPAEEAGAAGILSRLGVAGRLGRLGGLGRFAGLARMGGMAGRVASPLGIGVLLGTTALQLSGHSPGGRAGGVLSGAATGAGIGAIAGSVIPGLGTGVGALLGAGIGGGIGYMSSGRPSAAQRAGQLTGAVNERLSLYGGDTPKTMGDLARQVGILRMRIRDYGHDHTHTAQLVVGQLKQELGARAQVLTAMQKQQAATVRARGIERATRLLPGFGREFNYLRGRQGVTGAATTVTGDIITAMNKLPEAGRLILARGSLAWIAEAQRQNPKLRGQYEKMKDAIIDSFRATHRGVRIWNDKILLGTQTQWSLIAKAMGDPLERAKERLSGQFTYVQQEALQALQAMGFNRRDARTLISGLEAGGSRGSAANFIITHPNAPAGANLVNMTRRPNAMGGRLGGAGLHDTVPVGPMDRAAPGELIVNRHTERRVNFMLGGRATLGGEVAKENKPHSASFAYGGRMGGSSSLAGVHEGIRNIAMSVMGRFPLTVTSTTGGGHAADSYHYKGMAVDLGGSARTMNAAASWILHSGLYRNLLEGIHNPNLSVKNGQVVPAGFWGGTTWGQHLNHIHLAAGAGGGARGGGGLHPAAAAAAMGALGIPWAGTGVGGAMSFAVGSLLSRGMRRAVNRQLRGGAIAGGGGGGGGSAQTMAHRMMLGMGWGEGQWAPLHALWMRESGFNPMAKNPSSGAFGIPQALPASKMGAAAVAGDPAAQIRWGLNYIRGRYGTPGAAWQHEKFAGWYRNGFDGVFNTPTLIGAGEGARPERVTITPAGGGGRRAGVHIEAIHIQNHRPGDIRRQIREEVLAAYGDLADVISNAPMEGDGDLT